MRERRAKIMRPSGEEPMRELDEVDKDVADDGKCKEEWKMSWVQAEENKQNEEESEAAAGQKQDEIKDEFLTQPSNIDKSRVDKPGVQEVTMRKVAQAQAAHDVAAETCETAAQPIEQGSKRVSNSVRGVGSGLKVFISHCKRISGTEDKAIWIADLLDSSEVDVKAWFDLSDLSEITMLLLFCLECTESAREARFA